MACPLFWKETSAFAGAGFTTQDNEGEAIIVYMRLDYSQTQPITYTDIIRLTSGGRIKTVRMSGLIEYE